MAGEGSRPSANRWLKRLSESFDLPQDLVFDLPRITIIGGLQMTIENHRGLVEFSASRVTIGGNRGRIVVEGDELRIGVVHEEEITVTGELHSVSFQL